MTNTNLTKVTLSLVVEGTPDAKAVQNAVRRALSTGDVTITAGDKVESKGLTITATPLKNVPVKSQAAVREWVAANGFPEYANKRGRIRAEALAKYAEAHK